MTDNLASGGPLTASYTYLPDSDLLSTTTMSQGGTERLKHTRTWDTANRLQKIATTRGAQTLSSYEWHYDNAGRRDQATLADNSYWSYGYNERNEVKEGTRFGANNQAQAGYEFKYEFDAIGNRTTSTANGAQSVYTANSLNQYSSRTVPASIDLLGNVAGSGSLSAAVTGGDQTVALSTDVTGEFFARVPVDNSQSAQYKSLTVHGVKSGGLNGTEYDNAQSGNAFLAKSPEAYMYDADGNLIKDGRWTYVWDAENRLVSMETITTGELPSSVPRMALGFEYDYRGRRVSKSVHTGWNGTSYNSASATYFLYDDGWNILAEIDYLTFAPTKRYLWGSDISGSRDGAGGIGGLIAIDSLGTEVSLPAYDGNSNVVSYTGSLSGNELAHYTYGPFGEVLRETGTMAESNSFHFSNKYADGETGLVYYGYRYYQPQTGRWLGRDPLEEKGGINLTAFLCNRSPGAVDSDGRRPVYDNPDFPDWNDHPPEKPEPPQEPSDGTGGIGYMEGGFNYVLHASDVYVPFSSVDPGWSLENYVNPCLKEPGVYTIDEGQPFDLLSSFSNFRKNAGPGRIVVKLSGTLTVTQNGYDGCKIWSFSGFIYAPPDYFDFDPRDNWEERGVLKEWITRRIHNNIPGENFWIHFTGNRQIKDGGRCER